MCSSWIGQQKNAWFESDFYVRLMFCTSIAAFLTVDLFCSQNFTNVVSPSESICLRRQHSTLGFETEPFRRASLSREPE